MGEPALRGGCACRKITFESNTPPGQITYCYCKECAKVSGAGFIAFAAIESAKTVRWSREPDIWESSKVAKRGFCATCGSTLTMSYHGANERMGIAIGAIDHSSVPLLPQYHIFVKEKEPWVVIPDDGRPRYDLHETSFQARFEQWTAEATESG